MPKITYQKFERQRVDAFLAETYPEYSRSYFQNLIEKSSLRAAESGAAIQEAKNPVLLRHSVPRNDIVLVNGKPVLSSFKLKNGDIISFEFPKEEKTQIIPEKIKLDVIFEDNDILVINKQPGIVVHPSYGHETGTLLNAVTAHAKGKFVPYLVHRLDKDTSGLIIFAKNEKSKISISKQLQNRAVDKIYLAAVKGTIVENKGRIEAPLGRSPQNRKLMSVNPLAKKMAISEFTVMARKEDYTLVEVRIITGRTHQIRSHMKYINHPVIGDSQYGGPATIDGKTYERQMLHAYSVEFTHPKTCKTVKFTAPLPADMKEIFK